MIAITIAACAGFLAGAIIQAKIEDYLRKKSEDELKEIASRMKGE